MFGKARELSKVICRRLAEPSVDHSLPWAKRSALSHLVNKNLVGTSGEKGGHVFSHLKLLCSCCVGFLRTSGPVPESQSLAQLVR